MPQFDFFSFFVQIFWLSLFSCAFYLVYLKLLVNNLSQAMKMRSKLRSYRLRVTGKTSSTTANKTNFIYNKAVSFFL